MLKKNNHLNVYESNANWLAFNEMGQPTKKDSKACAQRKEDYRRKWIVSTNAENAIITWKRKIEFNSVRASFKSVNLGKVNGAQSIHPKLVLFSPSSMRQLALRRWIRQFRRKTLRYPHTRTQSPIQSNVISTSRRWIIGFMMYWSSQISHIFNQRFSKRPIFIASRIMLNENEFTIRIGYLTSTT